MLRFLCVAVGAWLLCLAALSYRGGLSRRIAQPAAITAGGPARSSNAQPPREPPLELPRDPPREKLRDPLPREPSRTLARQLPFHPHDEALHLTHEPSTARAAPEVSGALAALPAGVELVWTRTRFATPPHSDASHQTLEPALAELLPEHDLPAELPARSCAVVGSSGTLLRSGYGPSIDAHDLVWRFNGAPAGGLWAQDVGSRTTISILADVQTRQCIANKAARVVLKPNLVGGARAPTHDNGLLATDNGAPLLRVREPIAGCNFYPEATERSTIIFIPRKNAALSILRYAAAHLDGPRVLVRSDLFGDHVDSHIAAFAEGRSHPTSGYNGVHAALALCATVDVYGFGSPQEHYFSPPREEREGSQHLYRSEHAWLLALELRYPGRVRVWR